MVYLRCMKSLSLTKPQVLIIIGLPGSGKSFFARQFSETFSAPVVSYDQIRHGIFEQASYDKNELSTIQRIADYQLNELLKTQKTVIFDGGGDTRSQRMDLRKRVRGAGYDTLLIWVQTDSATARYRSMKRSSRRIDDQYNQSLSAQQYEYLAKRFTAPISSESSVVVSGKHTYPTQAKVVLKKLVIPREEQANSRLATKHGSDFATRTPERPLQRRNILIR